MSGAVIRHLNHAGDYVYCTGTDANGDPQWGPPEDARVWVSAQAAARMTALCVQAGYDVEVRAPGRA